MHAALIDVLLEARTLLSRPDNDFSRSTWDDAAEAVAEIDAALKRVRADDVAPGRMPIAITVLFAPTGPLQEVALSSGWGDEFLAVADRFDTAIAAP